MKKIIICIITIHILSVTLHSQSHPFKLIGKLPDHSFSSVELSPSEGVSFKLDKAFIFQDSFVISGTLKNPYIFSLIMKNDSSDRVSNFFIVEPGEHFLKINYSDSVFAVDGITNSPVEDEYLNKFLPFFCQKEFHTLPDKESLASAKRFFEDNIFGLEMNFISEYLEKDPRSFVGFLFFYRKALFSRADHNEAYQKILLSLDTTIKNSATGKELFKLFQNEESLLVGKIFPSFILKGTDNQAVAINYRGNSLTIVDYWATWCTPCIREIPELKNIYKKYKDRNLNIISISVDESSALPKLKKFIDSLGMGWVNYWDENRKVTDQYKIFLFPTYFLLDEEGKIIARGNRLTPILEIIKNRFE